MFWTVLRWGGSAAVILLVLAAAYFSIDPGATTTTDMPAQPVEAAPQPAKNFNL